MIGSLPVRCSHTAFNQPTPTVSAEFTSGNAWRFNCAFFHRLAMTSSSVSASCLESSRSCWYGFRIAVTCCSMMLCGSVPVWLGGALDGGPLGGGAPELGGGGDPGGAAPGGVGPTGGRPDNPGTAPGAPLPCIR